MLGRGGRRPAGRFSEGRAPLKITMNVDITPEEMRRLVGLPDVKEFNDHLMEKIREKMEAGVEGYDPMSLFQPYMKTTMAGFDLFSRMMDAAMRGTRAEEPEEPQGRG